MTPLHPLGVWILGHQSLLFALAVLVGSVFDAGLLLVARRAYRSCAGDFFSRCTLSIEKAYTYNRLYGVFRGWIGV